MLQSVEQAIDILSRNVDILAKQVARVPTPEQLVRLNSVINNQFTTVNTILTAHQDSINGLDARIALNPIPTFAEAEIPGGAINSSNTTFTLAHTPVTGSVRLFVGATPTAYGTLALQSVHYTIAGTIITFQAGFIPATNSYIRAYYRY